MLHTTWRILRAGIAAAVLVAAASWSMERVRFGASDQEAVARIERELDQRFRESADTLSRIAAEVVAERIAIGSTPRGQFPASRMFDAVDRALSPGDADRTGITVYDDPLGEPVAWAGRTSELPKERIERSAALLYAPGPLGPRLIRIEPVVDRSRPTGGRLGTVVVERQLGPVRGTPRVTDTFIMSDTLVPVSLRVRVGDVAPAVPYTFVIPSPSGGPLVDAEVSPADLAAARARWADRTWAGMLSIAGITLLLCAGPLLERRRHTRDTRVFVLATVGVVAAILIARVVFWFAASPLLGPRPLTSPLDLIVTALAFTAIVWITLDSIERWRLAGPRPRLLLGTAEVVAWVALAYVAAGVAVTAIVWSVRARLARRRVPDHARPPSVLTPSIDGRPDRARVRPRVASRGSDLERCRRHAASGRLADTSRLHAAHGGGGVAHGRGPGGRPAARPRPRAADRTVAGRRRRRWRRLDRAPDDVAMDASCHTAGTAVGAVPRAAGAGAGDVPVALRVHDCRQGTTDRDRLRPAGRASTSRSPERPVTERSIEIDHQRGLADLGRRLTRDGRGDAQCGVRRLVENGSAYLPIDVGGGAVQRQRAAGQPFHAHPGVRRDPARVGRMQHGGSSWTKCCRSDPVNDPCIVPAAASACADAPSERLS